MNPEQASFYRDMLIGQWTRESPVTRKVIAAVPEASADYRPDQKSMTARELAWHIVISEEFFLRFVLAGKMEGGEQKVPENTSIADIVARYDANIAPLVDKVKNAPIEQLITELNFFDMFKDSGLSFLTLMMSHGIHHRGQLSAYLRPMGGRVPGIYGPSGDDPLPQN